MKRDKMKYEEEKQNKIIIEYVYKLIIWLWMNGWKFKGKKTEPSSKRTELRNMK